jgi:pimeloyl-ACP methyl ester carboxylesterase
MKLHYREMGEGSPLLILHGLFGYSDNWQTLGKKFAQDHQVFLIDQRNHGRSPHSEEFNYGLMAQDLLELIEEHQLEAPAIMGHSMGGKTAMTFALQHPDRLSRLIVVDIAPKEYPIRHDGILDALLAVDLSQVSSRDEADAQLARGIDHPAVRQFLLKNLYRREDNSFAWRPNLPAIDRNLDYVSAAIEAARPFDKPTLFIDGGKSYYIRPEDHDLIRQLFPNAQIETVPEAGHWVHAEAPQKVYELVRAFLNQDSQD